MANYGDCNPIDYQEIWEYLGHNADGAFKIDIEFDEAPDRANSCQGHE